MKKGRLTSLLIVWGVAFAALLVIESCLFKYRDVLLLVPCFWMFPGGLITEPFGLELGDSWFGLAFGWLAYLAVILLVLFSNRRLLYYTFFCILCLMLILNIVGCHKDIVDFSES